MEGARQLVILFSTLQLTYLNQSGLLFDVVSYISVAGLLLIIKLACLFQKAFQEKGSLDLESLINWTSFWR